MSNSETHRSAHRIPSGTPDVDVRTRRVLLLGECNPQSIDPYYALWDQPVGCAGHNLQMHVIQRVPRVYRSYWRANLCSPTWDSKQAYLRAWDLIQPDVPWTRIVCLGRKVEKVMRFAGGELEVFASKKIEVGGREFTLLSLPHPSGVCRDWNDPESYKRAHAALMECGVIA